MSNSLLRIVNDTVDLAVVQEFLSDDSCGAQLIFSGVVRNTNEGRRVSAVTYEIFNEMAYAVLLELEREARARIPGLLKVAIVHRVGTLKVGEVSTVVGVSTAHRGESYDASRYLIEELKQRVPVWKEEHYEDGEKTGLEGSKLTAAGCGDSRRGEILTDGDAEAGA